MIYFYPLHYYWQAATIATQAAQLSVLADAVLKDHAARKGCYSKNGCIQPTTFDGEDSPCKTCQYALCDCPGCQLARSVNGKVTFPLTY
jgi:hypothetical protein